MMIMLQFSQMTTHFIHNKKWRRSKITTKSLSMLSKKKLAHEAATCLGGRSKELQ